MQCLCRDEGCTQGCAAREVSVLRMTQAIRDAKFLTYTYSWDFSHTLRNPPDDEAAPSIGEILKGNADKGATLDAPSMLCLI